MTDRRDDASMAQLRKASDTRTGAGAVQVAPPPPALRAGSALALIAAGDPAVLARPIVRKSEGGRAVW
jgi:hypothetical protein